VIPVVKNAPRGRPPFSLNTRDRIIDEAAVIFSRHGYASGSIRDLAEELGFSKAAVYHYFTTKQEIYDAITNKALEGLTAAVSAAIEPHNTADRKLMSFMCAHARQFEADYWRCSTMLVAFGGLENITRNRVAAKLRRNYEFNLRQILADGIAAGSFRPMDVAVTGRAILSMLNWMVRWFKPGGGRKAEEFAMQYFNLLLPGLRRADHADASDRSRQGSHKGSVGHPASSTRTAKSAIRKATSKR
jgi:AcrR family transcriptional regulator